MTQLSAGQRPESDCFRIQFEQALMTDLTGVVMETEESRAC